MFFSNKPNLVLYLKPQSLEFYDQKGQHLSLEFPETIVKNLEVVDPEKFNQLVNNFLKNLNQKKQKVILVLADNVVFQKILEGKEEKQKEEKERFLEEIPFSPEKLAKKEVKIEGKTTMLAINKEFCDLLSDILEKFNWSILRIIPASIFKDLKSEEELTSEEVKVIIKNFDNLKISDFLIEEQVEKQKETTPKTTQVLEEKSDKKTPLGTYLFIFLGLMTSIILLIGIALAVGLVKLPQEENQQLKEQTKEALQSPTPTVVLESTPSATLKKEEIKIQVLNGSGVTGQAGKVKKQLLEIGYTTVETGNKERENNVKTEVTFSSKVSEKNKKEIITELEKIFSEVSIKNSEEEDFEITIVTGEEK